MKLPAVYIFKKFKTGLTLIELLIVITILVFLIIISLPLTMNFYQIREIDVYENSIVQALRKAQLKAILGERDSSFGLYITSDQYVLFKGDSYLNRDFAFDEVFDLPNNLEMNGLSEIVFSKLKGIPSNTGTITLTVNSQQEIININEAGTIDY